MRLGMDLYKGSKVEMNNPFKNWKVPIENPDEFYGRKEQIRIIYDEISKLSGSSSIEIVGERRIGKTSLLKIISNSKFIKLHQLDVSNFIFVLFDMQGDSELITPKEFYFRTIDYIKEELENRDDAKYKDIISDINQKQKFNEIRKFDFYKICSKLKKLNINLVVLFDEFDSIEKHTNLDVNFFDALRSLQTANYVVYITAATKKINQIVPTHLETSTFFSYFDRIYLGLLKDDEALDLLNQESKKIGVSLEEEEIRFILDYAGTHPVLLKIATYHLIENRDNFKKNIDIIKKEITKDAKEIIDPQWNRLNIKKQLAILTVLKDGEITGSSLETVQDLKDRGIVIKKGKLKLFSKVFEEIISSKDDNAISNLKRIFGDSWNKLGNDSKISLRTAEIDLENHKSYPTEEFDWDGIMNCYRKVFESEIREKIFRKIREDRVYSKKIIDSEYKCKIPNYKLNEKLISFIDGGLEVLDLGSMSYALRCNEGVRSFLREKSNNDGFYDYNHPDDCLPSSFIHNNDFSELTDKSWERLANISSIVAEKYRNIQVHGGISPKALCLECRNNLIFVKRIIPKILESLTYLK